MSQAETQEGLMIELSPEASECVREYAKRRDVSPDQAAMFLIANGFTLTKHGGHPWHRAMVRNTTAPMHDVVYELVVQEPGRDTVPDFKWEPDPAKIDFI